MPANAVLEVAGQDPAKGTVDVIWNEIRIRMFAIDLKERGDALERQTQYAGASAGQPSQLIRRTVDGLPSDRGFHLKYLPQSLNEFVFGGVHFLPGFVQVQECGSVYFRKRLLLPGLRRPLY